MKIPGEKQKKKRRIAALKVTGAQLDLLFEMLYGERNWIVFDTKASRYFLCDRDGEQGKCAHATTVNTMIRIKFLERVVRWEYDEAYLPKDLNYYYKVNSEFKILEKAESVELFYGERRVRI